MYSGVGGISSTVSSQAGPSKAIGPSFSISNEFCGQPSAIVEGMQRETHSPMSLCPKQSL